LTTVLEHFPVEDRPTSTALVGRIDAVIGKTLSFVTVARATGGAYVAIGRAH